MCQTNDRSESNDEEGRQQADAPQTKANISPLFKIHLLTVGGAYQHSTMDTNRSMSIANQQYPSIYIIGAQCTGKTTLVKALEHHFTSVLVDPPFVITEIARGLLRKHKITRDEIRNDPTQSGDFQRAIMEAQLKQEETCQAPLQLSDRSGLDPIVYAKRFGPIDAAGDMLDSSTWAELRLRLASSVIVVCEPRREWLTDDGTRLMPLDWDDWTETHRVFCSLLDGCGLKYSILPAVVHMLSDRVDFVLLRWQDMLK